MTVYGGHLHRRPRPTLRLRLTLLNGILLIGAGAILVLLSWTVVSSALRPSDQHVIVGPKSSLERTTLTASGVNWIVGEPTGPIRVSAQIRHRHRPAPCTARAIGEERAQVVFDEPQIAITPGQAVVFYRDDVVAGGGWID